MKGKIPALAKRSLALALALALLLSLCPVIPLTAKAEHAGTWQYKSGYEWISGSFNSEDTDLVYEGDQAYDWSVVITPGRTPPATADVVASIKDAEGNVVSEYTGSVSGLAQHTEGVLCSFENFPELTADLEGTFTLTCQMLYKGTLFAQLEQTFSREAGETPVETTEGEEEEIFVFTDGWTYKSGYEWISGSITSKDSDLVFEGEQAYDWTVLITPGRTPPASADVVASIKDAEGNVVSEYTGTASGLAQHTEGVLCSFENFPELTADLEGTFTLTCQMLYKGSLFAQVEKEFSRVIEAEEPEETTPEETTPEETTPEETTPDEPDEPIVPDDPEGTVVTSAYAYLDSMLEPVMENITNIRGLNLGTDPISPYNRAPAKQGDNCAWDLGPNCAYIFTLSEEFLKDFDGNVTITVEYYDVSSGTGQLVYHSTSGTATAHPDLMTLNGKGDFSVQTATFTLTDAVFTDVYEKGASFAIYYPIEYKNGRFYFKSVKVEKPTGEVGTAYTLDLNSEAEDLKFYDTTPFDMNLTATTDGNIEVVTATYTLTGGNLAEAVTGTKTVTLIKNGVTVLDAAWFNENAIGYGSFTLEVALTNADGATLVTKTITFERTYSSILSSAIVFQGGEDRNDLRVFGEDEKVGITLYLNNKLNVPFTGNVTVSFYLNGALYNDQTFAVSNLGNSFTAVGMTVPQCEGFGNYEMVVSVTDEEGNEVYHSKPFKFARAKNVFVSGSVSSEIAGEELVFVNNQPFDLVLNAQKADGFDEELTFEYSIMKDNTLVKSGTFTATATAASVAEISLAEILADVEGYGNFTIEIDATNAYGYANSVCEVSFTRIETVTVELISASNPDLIFNDEEPFDLKLVIKSATGEDCVYTVDYRIFGTQSGVTFDTLLDKTIPAEGLVIEPNMSSAALNNDTFTAIVKLYDANGKVVKEAEFQFSRIPSMEAEVIFRGNEAGYELPTFIDLVTIEAAVSLKKPMGEAEQFTINYTVTDKDGNEVIASSTTANVGTSSVNAVLDLSKVNNFGTYTITATVLDAIGNQVATASAEFARVEIVTTALTSSSNSDLVFNQGQSWDLVLHLKQAGTPEALKALIVITDNDGNKLVEKNVNLPAKEYTKGNLVDLVDMSTLPETGIFTLSLKVGDAQNRLREDAVFTFSRVALEGSVESAFKSATSENLVFAPGGDIDMMLYIQKTDGIQESFAVVLTVTDAEGTELLKKEATLDSITTFKAAVADLVDLSSLTTGSYNVNLTITDNSGIVRNQNTTAFTLVSLEGSVETAITSETNPDLIFTEGEEFDLTLHMRKNDGIAEAFKAYITLTDGNGNELKTASANVPARESMKVSVNDLVDLSDLPTTGSYKLNIVLKDAAGNERLNETYEFHRVKLASVKTQVSSNSNRDMIFIDKDTVDLMLYVQKTDSIAEELIIYYSIMNPNGDEIATAEGTTVVKVAPDYFKMEIELDPETVTAHGMYTAYVMVMDNNGNIRSETTTKFARTSGGIKHQVSGSSTGTKMQFTPGQTIDLCLFAVKTDGVAETVKAELYVISPSGKVVYSITGNLNIPTSGYFKHKLPLDGQCTEYGIYKVNYNFYDDAGNLRVSNSASFRIISPTGEMAVAVQSASSKPGMIYTNDEPFDLVLYLQKADGVEQTLKLRYTIYDINGLVVDSKQGNVNVPALGYRKIELDLSGNETFEKYGIYTIKVEVAGDDGKLIYNEEFSFSRVLAPEKQLSIMGVCTHLSKKGMSTKQSQYYVDLARMAGISFWRDELPWSSVEPAKGQYTIAAAADAAVDYTLSIGLEPLFILDYGNSNYGSDVTTDEWLQGYLGYVEYMVTHFKGRIKYYEVWNEWNIGLGGMDKKYRDMADVYAKLLIETYKVIKAIDPTITVIGGVVAGGEEKWTENFLKCPGAIDAMDVFSYHEYPDNDFTEFVEQYEVVRALMAKYGRPDIPMWVTETGYPTHIGRNSFTEEEAAGNLVSLYTWAIANPDALDQIFWYDLHNDGVERENGEHNFGLLDNWNVDTNTVPMAAKPAFVALCAMNTILADAEFVGLYDMGHKDISAYHFKKDGKDLLVAWADDVALNMVATVGENNIIVTDMYGNANALIPADGKVSLFFSDSPIYIEYDLSNKLEMIEGGFTLDQAMYSATPAATFPVKITRNNGLETYSGSYAFFLPDGWSVENIEFGAAEAGATEIVDTVYVTVSDGASKGESTLTVRVISDGNTMGQFNIPIEMGDVCTVNPDVVFTENGPEFKVSVQVLNENSTKPLSGTINLLSPAALLGEASSVAFEIPAGENKAVLIDVPAEFANTFHTVKLEVVLGSGAKHEVSKPMSFLYAIEAPENMKLDGVIDEQWNGAMEFTIGEDDWCNTTDSDAEWPGNTAKGYAMWDAQYLYVAVEVHDASHYQTGTGTSIWTGDSIQLTTDISRFTVPAYYGYNEVGFSMNSENGTIENWNWFASPGKNVSEGGIFKIVRDDATETTTYEVALPWTELLPKDVEFDFRSIGFALIVNENSIDEDGEVTGRTGWIEYMSGIGLRKEPEKFGDLILVNRSEIK